MPAIQAKKNNILSKQNYKVVFPLIGILILTFLVYFKSLKNGFTNYDDEILILNNPLVRALSVANLKIIFTSFINGMYHPLVTLSWAIEYHFWGSKAMGYHLVNLIFHLMNTWLVYRFILLLTKRINVAVIVTLFFAIHPMISESVLWLSELKDLLCVAFIMGGLIHYLKYLNNAYRAKYLILTFIFFVFSLFSKPLAIVFPFLLLVIDYYSERKFDKKVLLEKLPFFIFSISFGVIAIIAAESVEGINTLHMYSIIDRIAFVTYAIIFYIIKLFVPIGLSAKHFYPLKSSALLPFEYYISILIFILLIVFIIKIRKHRKEIISGILFFIVCISIILPVVPVGDSVVSDRYSYLSYIGLFLILGNLYDMYKNIIFTSKVKLTYIMNITILLLVAFFCFITFNRIAVWANSNSLWTDVIKKDASAYLAYTARGDSKSALFNYDAAIDDYSKAIEINPASDVAFNNRGYAWLKEKEYKKAESDFNNAILLKPAFSKAYYNRSCLWIEAGEYKKAISDCDKTLSLTPGYAYAYYNRGDAEYLLNEYKEAVSDFNNAISIDDGIDVFYYYRGLANYKLNNYLLAKNDFDKTLLISPDYDDAYYYRARCNYDLKDYNAAIFDFDKHIANMPKDVESIYRRGDSKLLSKDFKGAIDDFNYVITLDVDFAPAYYGRAMANIATGNTNNICTDLMKAKELGLEISSDLLIDEYCK